MKIMLIERSSDMVKNMLKNEISAPLNLSEDELLCLMYAGKYILEQHRTNGTINEFVNELTHFTPTKHQAFIRKKLTQNPVAQTPLKTRLNNIYVHLLAHTDTVPKQDIPLYSTHVSAGLPALADDHIEQYLDLSQYFVKTPTETFAVRAEGNSMTGAGIQENDILIVDRSIEPKNGNIVIAALNGELTVKRLKSNEDGLWLMPENPNYLPIKITEYIDFKILGIVIHVIHSF